MTWIRWLIIQFLSQVEKAKPKCSKSKWAKVKAIFHKNKVEPVDEDDLPKSTAHILPRKESEFEFPDCWPFTELDNWLWDEKHICAFYDYVNSMVGTLQCIYDYKSVIKKWYVCRKYEIWYVCKKCIYYM